jgi:hypothetical protein
LFTAMTGIFTPAYSVSKRTGSDGRARSAYALFTTNLLHDAVKVGTQDGDIWVVGAEGGLADLQGPLVFDAGAGQVTQMPPKGPASARDLSVY